MKPDLMLMALLSAVAVMAAACGTEAPGAGTPFCANVATLSARLLSNEHQNSELSFFKGNEAKIDALAIRPPAPVTEDVHTYVTGVDKAIAASDTALANTGAMNKASDGIKAYCGIRQ